MSSRQSARVFMGVTLLLFTAGWAANHFASALVIIRDQQGVPSLLVNAAFAFGAHTCTFEGKASATFGADRKLQANRGT